MKFKYKFKKLRVIINNKLYKKHTPDSNEVLIKKTIASLLSNDKNIITVFPKSEFIYINFGYNSWIKTNFRRF
jgi:hypothetical protein